MARLFSIFFILIFCVNTIFGMNGINAPKLENKLSSIVSENGISFYQCTQKDDYPLIQLYAEKDTDHKL